MGGGGGGLEYGERSELENFWLCHAHFLKSDIHVVLCDLLKNCRCVLVTTIVHFQILIKSTCSC